MMSCLLRFASFLLIRVANDNLLPTLGIDVHGVYFAKVHVDISEHVTSKLDTLTFSVLPCSIGASCVHRTSGV